MMSWIPLCLRSLSVLIASSLAVVVCVGFSACFAKLFFASLSCCVGVIFGLFVF